MACLIAPIADAIEAFAAVLPHALKGGSSATPVLECVQVKDGNLNACDRMTAALFELCGENDGEPFLVPYAAASWIVGINTKTLRGRTPYSIGIDGVGDDATPEEIREGEVTVQIIDGSGKVERSQSFDPISGNFPPTVRLIDGFDPAADAWPVGMTPANLRKVLDFAAKWHKYAPVTFELGKTESAHRLAPVRASVGRLTALIQPVKLA